MLCDVVREGVRLLLERANDWRRRRGRVWPIVGPLDDGRRELALGRPCENQEDSALLYRAAAAREVAWTVECRCDGTQLRRRRGTILTDLRQYPLRHRSG